MNKLRILVLILALVSVSALAHEYVPGEPQSQPILLRGGDLYTISGDVLFETDLLFENGVVTQIGKNLTPPENTRVIEVAGKRVYPGLIDAWTVLGLVEITAIRASDDRTEVGRATPEVSAHIAFNCDSELLPTVRANGVSTALVVPGGNLLCGRSSLMNLDCWTWEDGAEKLDVGMHLSWPRSRIITAWWMDQTPEEQRKNNEKNKQSMFELFSDARAYWQAKQADPSIERDLRWEAMMPLFTSEMPLIVEANSYEQIEEAIAFAQRENFRLILAGAREAWRLTDLIKKHDIPIIFSPTYRTPMREDDDYDMAYKTAGLLEKAGIRFCIASFSGTNSRNLPFQAGMAHAFGLSAENAIRAITLAPAEILGVDNALGSLEIGKKATLIVSEGDVMDHLSHGVTMMFIGGAEVDLSSKHTELYEKYQQKHWTPSD